MEEKEGTAKAIAVDVAKVICKRNGTEMRHTPDNDESVAWLCADCTAKFKAIQGEVMTIRTVCVNALDHIPFDATGRKKEIENKEKLKRGLLAEKIYKAEGSIELQIDELALIKKLVGETNDPIIVSQVYPIIDPKAKDTEEK